MKTIKVIFAMMSALLLTSAFAAPSSPNKGLNLKALSCSGLGLTNGYTTINYIGDDTFTVTSLKYFIQTYDTATVVQSKTDRKTGDLTLQFFSKKYKSVFLLKLYNESTRGDLITADGTDTLVCTSYFGK